MTMDNTILNIILLDLSNDKTKLEFELENLLNSDVHNLKKIKKTLKKIVNTDIMLKTWHHYINGLNNNDEK